MSTLVGPQATSNRPSRAGEQPFAAGRRHRVVVVVERHDLASGRRLTGISFARSRLPARACGGSTPPID